MLQSRLITAFILIPLVILTLFLLPFYAFAILIIIICMIAAWEWGKLAGIKDIYQYIWLSIFFCFLLFIVMISMQYYQINLHLFQIEKLLIVSICWWIIALILVIFYPNSAILWRKSRQLIILLFGFFTLVPFFFSVIKLRQYHYDINQFIGSWWLLFVILLVWGADSGAYIFGKILGKYQMAFQVSPNKTWEGFFGGLFSSLTIALVFGLLAPIFVEFNKIIASAFIITITASIGDLTESMFKREAGIKDSSNLIPGHGGILDRIDSLTSTVPIFSCLLLVFHIL